MKPLKITAEWDADACVWIATSHDIDGLAIEASTMDALVERLKIVIPELIELNHKELMGATLFNKAKEVMKYGLAQCQGKTLLLMERLSLGIQLTRHCNKLN